MGLLVSGQGTVAGASEIYNETLGLKMGVGLIPEQISNDRLIRVKLFTCSVDQT